MLGETIGSINFSTVSTSAYLITRVNNINGTTVTQYPETTITHIHLISTSGGGSNLQIANGLGGTVYINITGTTSKGIDFDFGAYGITFPLGAYLTTDGNISNAAITCKASKF